MQDIYTKKVTRTQLIFFFFFNHQLFGAEIILIKSLLYQSKNTGHMTRQSFTFSDAFSNFARFIPRSSACQVIPL